MIESPYLENLRGYVAGEWVGGDAGGTFAVTNPATGAKLADVAEMGRAETDRAVAAAVGALERDPDRAEAKRRCERIAEALLDARDEIGRILTSEHGKPLEEGRGEVAYAAGFFKDAARHVDELAPESLDGRPKDCAWTVHHRPTGVVALVTPWNFPIGMIAKKLAPAIATGCPSVIKPSSKTPLTMIALFALLDRELDLPAGFANLVMGPASEIGDALCDHPDVRLISFTGSTGVGRHLMERCAPTLKRLALELGGNAPFVIFDDADLDAAVDHLIANKFRGGGQTCVCANRVYVQEGIAEDFARRLADKVDAMKVGDGLEEGTDLGPLIDRAGFDKVRRHVADALERGAEKITARDAEEPDDDARCFHPPTVLRGVTEEMACCREETFGPLVPLLAFADEDEVLRRANDTEFGLAAYLFTADEVRAQRCIAELRFGHVGWNTGAGPTPECPFGGVKQSGFGREGGSEAVFEYVEAQTVPRGG